MKTGFDALRKDVRKLIVDCNLDRPGFVSNLARAINIHRSSVGMALTGYRKTDRSYQILEELKIHLLKLQMKQVKRQSAQPGAVAS